MSFDYIYGGTFGTGMNIPLILFLSLDIGLSKFLVRLTCSEYYISKFCYGIFIFPIEVVDYILVSYISLKKCGCSFIS